MNRYLCTAMLLVASTAPVQAEEDLAGVWRNTLQEFGVSFWELTPKKGGGYVAQEVGLGNRHGTATVKDNVLVIEFMAEDHKGVYEWQLKGPVGQGIYTQTHTDEEVWKLKTSVRYIGK